MAELVRLRTVPEKLHVGSSPIALCYPFFLETILSANSGETARSWPLTSAGKMKCIRPNTGHSEIRLFFGKEA